jgi:penicillin-binding protein 2
MGKIARATELQLAHWIGNEERLPQTRLTAAQYVVFATTLLLILGFFKLQIIDSNYYFQLAERNRIRSIPIIAPRGRMLDREGRTIVDNYPSFSVLLLREDAALLEKHLPEVAAGLGLSLEEVLQRLDSKKHLPKFTPVVIKDEATPADLAYIESHRADLPLLELLMVHRRKYPSNGFMAHGIGYVGEASEQQVERSGGKLQPGDMVGKTGLEQQYNHILMGVDGMRRVIVNSVGKPVESLAHVEAIAGKPIQLTIDYDLQVVAEAAMAGRKGAVVALDPRTGEVLAMTSQPAPDPNVFAIRVPREEWKRLNEDPDHPLLNRAIQAQLAPGSVFKIVMTTAMLETKTVPESFTAYCPGYAVFYGRMFRCWVFNKGGHGVVDLHRAVVHSCDVYFYNVGQRLGIDRISYYAHMMGLGRRTGIDLPEEKAGLVPSEEWKKRAFKQPWYAGETISVAVGQGATIVTPLQLARTIGGIAMGGVFKQPHLLLAKKDLNEDVLALNEHTTEVVTQAMYGVVNEGGTAAASRLQGIEFCGKTGTSQLISAEGLKKVAGSTRKYTDNAWFVGYAPRRNPGIVVAVLVEHGEHGSSAAAPVARDIIKRYYEKKSAKEKQQFTVEFKRHDVDAVADPSLAAQGVTSTRKKP